MTKIVFASCRAKPDLQKSDVPLAEAFAARGFSVAAAPWNGPQAPFAEAAAVLIRST